MKKLFIFDLDGVLTSTSIEHFKAWKLVIRSRFNKEIDDSVEVLTKGVSRMESLNKILESLGLANELSHYDKVILATEKNELYKSMISRFDESNVYPGVIELFEFLKRNHILIALGSASRNGPSIIESIGIKNYFDFIVDPSKLKSKPNPDIFLKAMNHFELRSVECVGIEDAVSGVEAIKSSGMYAIGIGDKEELKQADIIYDSISDIETSFLTKLIEGEYGKT